MEFSTVSLSLPLFYHICSQAESLFFFRINFLYHEVEVEL